MNTVAAKPGTVQRPTSSRTRTARVDPRLCRCDSCGATREKIIAGDGWEVTQGGNQPYALCKPCALEQKFTDTLTAASSAFFSALFAAMPPELRRPAWDALEASLDSVQPEPIYDTHGGVCLERYNTTRRVNSRSA
jgi:hypothetical protein